jgi:tetratricopeptide (TPR) repeat protein
MALAEPTAEEQFASAFHDWGLDLDAKPTAETAARLKGRPAAVVTEVIAALDEWASQRRLDGKPETSWRRVAELAAALDAAPDSLSRELRAILESGQLPVERALGVLSAAFRPVPVPVAVPWGRNRVRLRELAKKIKPALEPVLGLLTLARALRVAGEEAEAERLLRMAVTVLPQEVVLYHALGQLLQEQEPPRWAEAAEFYRVARGLRPDLGVTLAGALLRSGREPEGLLLLVRLINARLTNPFLRFQLASALKDTGNLDGAIVFYRQAILFDPKFAQAYNNLGVALQDKGDVDGAIACYKKALELDPKFAFAQHNLGDALRAKGDLDGAVACFYKVLELYPKYAEAHCNLGLVLGQQGRFAEAVDSLRRGHELGSKRPGWRYPSAQWVRDTEQMLALDKKLPAILTGEATPSKAGEAVVLASMCQLSYQKRYAASARLYADAFAAEPKLAADLDQQHRYNAARNAMRAAAGQGEDAHLLPDRVVTMFRHWALGWLRDDLTAYAKLADQNNPAVKQAVQQRLAHWRQDPDLASVRDPQALDRLPENERASWQALWRDVDELAKKVEPTQGRKEPQAPEGRSAPPAGKSGH